MLPPFKPWMAWAVIVAALAALLGVQTVRLSDEQRDHAETHRKHAVELAQRADDAREAVRAARDEEQRRTAAVQEIADETQVQLDAARDDADAARDAGERLRQRVAQLTASISRGGTGNSATAGAGASAEKTADLLADVQRRLDEAADAIAGFADSAYTAGAACERSYKSLTK